MNLLRKASVLFLALLPFAITSCDNEPSVGDWDAFTWKIGTSSTIVKSPSIDVPAAGGEYTLHCTNYGSIWLINVSVNGEYVRNENEHRVIENQPVFTIDSEYVQAVSDGYDVTVTVPANPTQSTRVIVIEVESGDAFDSITLKQSAQ